jgi:hypothetical protein
LATIPPDAAGRRFSESWQSGLSSFWAICGKLGMSPFDSPWRRASFYLVAASASFFDFSDLIDRVGQKLLGFAAAMVVRKFSGEIPRVRYNETSLILRFWKCGMNSSSDFVAARRSEASAEITLLAPNIGNDAREVLADMYTAEQLRGTASH